MSGRRPARKRAQSQAGRTVRDPRKRRSGFAPRAAPPRMGCGSLSHVEAHVCLVSGKSFSCDQKPATRAARSLGRTRIELTIRTCGGSPFPLVLAGELHPVVARRLGIAARSHSLYTVAAQTPSCSATSLAWSSRSLSPRRAARSATVGVVRRGWTVPGLCPPRPGRRLIAAVRGGPADPEVAGSRGFRFGQVFGPPDSSKGIVF